MRTRLALTVLLVAAAAAAAVAFAVPRVAGGVTTDYLTLSGPTFAGREYSDHNNGATSACGVEWDPLQNAGEHLGALDNGRGRYLANVDLPQGATVTRFDLLVNDA